MPSHRRPSAWRLAEAEDVRQPGGQHPRLAGAGPGQHQHRAFCRLDRALLLRIQPLHVVADRRPDRRPDRSLRPGQVADADGGNVGVGQTLGS